MASPQTIDAATERLIGERLAARPQPLPRKQLLVETSLALATLAAASGLAVSAHAERPFSLGLALAFIAALALVHRVVFTLGEGIVVPTMLIFVPLLLLAPTPYVPLMTIVAVVVAAAESVRRGECPPQRLPLALNDAAFALAPAATLVAPHPPAAASSPGPPYAAALAAQFAADCVREIFRDRAVGLAPRVVLREIVQAYRVDLVLAPLGLLAAIAAAGEPATALLVLPIVWLLAHFAREREARVAQTVELGTAYRGTALLLRDLLEDDDEYTGHHTEDVVELSVSVAERMGVSEEIKRETEMGALLHDIGKIAIPDHILNKPGKLDAEEWAVMKTHTIVGQEMLNRVGGLLESVGRVVRASHERFDGGGYPDGLAGCAIPLPARIVIVCDSFNAMTTTRPYRAAMPVSEAVTELRRCSGTQFDPNVVDALLAVIGDPGWQLTVREPAPVPAARVAV